MIIQEKQQEKNRKLCFPQGISLRNVTSWMADAVCTECLEQAQLTQNRE